jgi:hypothetical protein
MFKIWDIDEFNLLKSIEFGPNINRIHLKSSQYRCIITAGLNLRLYNFDSEILDEFSRKNREDSVKFMIYMKNDKIVLATNLDIEFYALVNSSIVKDSEIIDEQNLGICSAENMFTTDQSYNHLSFRELKIYANAHLDTILCLESINGFYLFIYFLIIIA